MQVSFAVAVKAEARVQVGSVLGSGYGSRLRLRLGQAGGHQICGDLGRARRLDVLGKDNEGNEFTVTTPKI